MNKVHLVTFANGDIYIKSQEILNETINIANIDTHTMWRDTDIIKTQFYKNNKDIFKNTTGFGLWIWKPFIILEKLKEINDGDYVYYQDSSKYDLDGFKKSIRPIIEFMKNNNTDILPGLVTHNINKYLVQEECFKYMDADTDYYKNHKHIQTSPLFVKKTDFSIKFIREWLNYCTVPVCIKKLNRKKCAHQYDQAIVNILLVKYKIKYINHECVKLLTKSYNYYINLFYSNNFTYLE